MRIKTIGYLFVVICSFIPFIPVKAQKPRIIVDTATRLIDANFTPYNQLLPGDTLYFQAGKRDYLLIRNVHGEPGNPVVFLNLGGVVIVDTDHHYGISMGNCQFIKFTGTGTKDQFYGFRIQRVKGGAGLGIGNLSSDVEIDHFYIENVPIGGIYAKTDPDCSFASTRDKFIQRNTSIHDNYIEGVGNEGMYIGSSKYFGQIVNCNGHDTLLMPSLLSGVKIYNNIIRYSGWDGIQVSSASFDCQVHDNLVLFDSQGEQYGQMSGILLGGGSKCDCYNNYIADGKGDGIESHGLGGSRIFNNIIVNAGKTFRPGDSSQMKHGMYISDVSVQPDSSFVIIFNDIISPKSDGIRFASIHSRHNLVASNVIINPGNYDYYEHGQTGFTGNDAYVMIPDTSADVLLKNNYFSRSDDSTGFSATTYALQPGSPLIDAGYSQNMGVAFDFYNHERPYGTGYDIGAHEFNPEFLGVPEKKPLPTTKIIIYPNPARESLSVFLDLKTPSGSSLDIYDLSGNLIGHYNWGVLETGSHTKKVDVIGLPDGIYLLILRAGCQSHSGRFVKISG